jgi:hypothetical protein
MADKNVQRQLQKLRWSSFDLDFLEQAILEKGGDR